VDYEKAFHRVDWSELMKILQIESAGVDGERKLGRIQEYPLGLIL